MNSTASSCRRPSGRPEVFSSLVPNLAAGAFQKCPMRVLSFAIIAAAVLGAAGLARADDSPPKPDKPKYLDSGRVEGVFIASDKAKCEALCGRAYRSGRDLSNDICIATC